MAASVRGAALVTGADGGLGRVVAQRLAERGHDLVLVERDQPAVDRVVQDMAVLGRAVVGIAADVADRTTVEARLREARAVVGPILVVCNVAGIAESSPLVPPDDDLFDRTMATNTRGPWVVSTACLPGMLAARWGRIVNVASTAALHGGRYIAAYVTSKHALLGLTRALAEDLRGRGITVNAVCPGFLDTPMTARTIEKIVRTTGRTLEEALADILAAEKQSRLIRPTEVADAILRLVDAESTTGAAVEVLA